MSVSRLRQDFGGLLHRPIEASADTGDMRVLGYRCAHPGY
jgi:hypothetical protein